MVEAKGDDYKQLFLWPPLYTKVVGCLLNIKKCVWLGGKVRVKKMVKREWKMD